MHGTNADYYQPTGEVRAEGPYIIEKVYSNGAYLLITMDDEQIIPPTNARFLKYYYPFRKKFPDTSLNGPPIMYYVRLPARTSINCSWQNQTDKTNERSGLKEKAYLRALKRFSLLILKLDSTGVSIFLEGSANCESNHSGVTESFVAPFCLVIFPSGVSNL